MPRKQPPASSGWRLEALLLPHASLLVLALVLVLVSSSGMANAQVGGGLGGLLQGLSSRNRPLPPPAIVPLGDLAPDLISSGLVGTN